MEGAAEGGGGFSHEHGDGRTAHRMRPLKVDRMARERNRRGRDVGLSTGQSCDAVALSVRQSLLDGSWMSLIRMMLENGPVFLLVDDAEQFEDSDRLQAEKAELSKPRADDGHGNDDSTTPGHEAAAAQTGGGGGHCHMHGSSRPMYATVLVGVSHCGAGCMIADVACEFGV